MDRPDVVVVGAGLAGLCCALHVQEAGLSVHVLEASDGVGGRVRTDRVDGFLLDRGFQVLLTAYPAARRMLDYRRLDLRPFEPGALVAWKGKLRRVVDPARRPLKALRGLFAPVGSVFDKLGVRTLRKELLAVSEERIFARPETTTEKALRRRFGKRIVERFFRPFLGGVFLERELRTSSRMFEYVFRTFARDDAVLPAEGMGAIPAQIADRLDQGSVRVGARVTAVAADGATLDSGEEVEARVVVVATEGPEAARLLTGVEAPGSCAVTCLHFAADEPPVEEPMLVLDGEGKGPVNNLAVPSRVARTYAPEGQDLISASVLGDPAQDDAALEKAVREQMVGWFGKAVDGWRHLKTLRIPHALPAQPPGWLHPPERPVCVDRGLYVCGDHRDNASINGAMVSGHRAAEAVLAELGTG